LQALDKSLDTAAFQAHAIVDSGIIDEAVDGAEPFFDLSDRSAAARRVFELRLDQVAIGLCRLHLRHKLPNVIRAPSQYHYAGSLVEAGASDAGPDAGTAAGYDDDFILESKIHEIPLATFTELQAHKQRRADDRGRL
jgi:hypothetical protein